MIIRIKKLAVDAALIAAAFSAAVFAVPYMTP